jgi:hypothetical protein
VKAKSPGGKEFSTLTVEQLKQVKASTDPKVTPEMKQAAETLLSPVQGDEWGDWYGLVAQADAVGLTPPEPASGIPHIELYRLMADLEKQVEAKVQELTPA